MASLNLTSSSENSGCMPNLFSPIRCSRHHVNAYGAVWSMDNSTQQVCVSPLLPQTSETAFREICFPEQQETDFAAAELCTCSFADRMIYVSLQASL
ncbi:hypothetical protein TNCV_3265451 [Trichonephila clavipes]|nr:hypothetical protein TNCV_3265451 [Trichonephila clavipes]